MNLNIEYRKQSALKLVSPKRTAQHQ